MRDEYLENLFPAFLEIGNEELREKSEAAMRMAMEAGGWDEETLRLCPVTLNWEGCDVSWIEHVTDVTAACIGEYDRLAKYYRRHGAEFDRDTVAAGALLHDIGKLTEFVVNEKREPVHGGNFELMRHPLSGAILAAKAGLPDKIVHLIATHSFEGDRSYQTAESVFVRTIDMFVFNCSAGKGTGKEGEKYDEEIRCMYPWSSSDGRRSRRLRRQLCSRDDCSSGSDHGSCCRDEGSGSSSGRRSEVAHRRGDHPGRIRRRRLL